MSYARGIHDTFCVLGVLANDHIENRTDPEQHPLFDEQH